MPTTPILRLGTRRSPLAMAQAHEARARLCAAHGWDEGAVELVPVIATGDKIQDRPLAEIGGKALWTRELDIWLTEGRIDGAVHSMKDVETRRPTEIAIGAILPREDKADVLLGASSLDTIPQGAVIGTSAPRRAAQLLHRRPDCQIVSIRGNVATRRAKLEAGEADATFLAAAGLARLGETDVGTRLDPEDWFPAPAQAAIGIECRHDDERTQEIFATINHGESSAEVLAERRLLEGLGGTCSSPVAALSRQTDGRLMLRAVIFSPDGKERVEHESTFGIDDTEAPLELARRLLADSSPAITDHFGAI